MKHIHTHNYYTIDGQIRSIDHSDFDTVTPSAYVPSSTAQAAIDYAIAQRPTNVSRVPKARVSRNPHHPHIWSVRYNGAAEYSLFGFANAIKRAAQLAFERHWLLTAK